MYPNRTTTVRERLSGVSRCAAACDNRCGVTLLEILLVLAILALIAATAWPSLDRSLADQRLRDAADMVRAEWQHARAKAMESGVAYQFCYTPEDRTYWIEPWEDPASGTGDAASSGPTAMSGPDQLLLPEHVMFGESRIEKESSDAGAETEDASSGQDAASPSSSSDDPNETGEESIVFSPDGTCSSAELTLRNDHDRGIKVSIHGLTAIAVVGEVTDAEESSP